MWSYDTKFSVGCPTSTSHVFISWALVTVATLHLTIICHNQPPTTGKRANQSIHIQKPVTRYPHTDASHQASTTLITELTRAYFPVHHPVSLHQMEGFFSVEFNSFNNFFNRIRSRSFDWFKILGLITQTGLNEIGESSKSYSR